VQRGDPPPADPNPDPVDPDVNTWDTAGTWCVAVNDELERVVDEILETNPIAYTAAAEFHYARTRTGRDSDTDTDTEWQSDDEIPLARLVGVASDDSESDSESESSASDESDDDVVITARREPGDINGEALCEIAHAVELVKMLVSFRDEVGRRPRRGRQEEGHRGVDADGPCCRQRQRGARDGFVEAREDVTGCQGSGHRSRDPDGFHRSVRELAGRRGRR
jgi:hypothetical protein